jgi:molybdopterin-containing oxidoreductase family iron-sulfur binding subunit
VLPSHTALERWQLGFAENAAPGSLLVASTPLVEPVLESGSRHPAEIALGLGKELVAGSDDATVRPWNAESATVLFQEAVEANASAAGERAAELLERGFVWLAPRPTVQPIEARDRPAVFADRGGLEVSDLGAGASAPAAADSSAEEPGPNPALAQAFTLLPFETPHMGDGRGANRAWLQQLPDPLSTVMWGSWAELSHSDLERLGLRTGDWIEVTGPAATLLLPVVESPAARPGTVAIPLGYGHRAAGRYARDRGVNVLSLGAVAVPGLQRWTSVGLQVRVAAAERPADATFAQFGRGLRHAEDLPRRRGRPLRQAEVLVPVATAAAHRPSAPAVANEESLNNEGEDP